MKMPDTQGFLAIAIISIVSVIVLILLFHPLGAQISDTTQGMLMTLFGVLTAVLKDVYAYYFSSSSSSKAKDETIKTMAAASVMAPSTDPLAKWQQTAK